MQGHEIYTVPLGTFANLPKLERSQYVLSPVKPGWVHRIYGRVRNAGGSTIS